MAEFENMSFKEQLELVHNTDILVGVHGAGLTHGIFLRPNSALVEIMPPGLDHKGFRNLAKQMGHLYFRIHGSEQSDSNEEGLEWQHDDVYMEGKGFEKLVRAAVLGMYHRGYLDGDVV